MSLEANPYIPPTTTPPPLDTSRDKQKWQVQGGALWVKDGAKLPDLCLDGSARTRQRGAAKLRPGHQLFNRLMLGSTLVGATVIVILALRETYGLAGFTLTTITLTIISSLGSVAIAAWKGWNKSITIDRSIGWRANGRVIVGILLAISAFLFASFVLAYLSETLGLPQRQQMGLSQALLFTFCMSQGLGFRMTAIHPVETENGWYRLKGVHPLAIASLARVQAAEGDDSSA